MVCWWVLVHCGWNGADCILQGQREPIGNIWEQVENRLRIFLRPSILTTPLGEEDIGNLRNIMRNPLGTYGNRLRIF